MNYTKALELLELKDTKKEPITLFLIKKQYHKLALKYHPDKNIHRGLQNNAYKFEQLNDAYVYLQKNMGQNQTGKNQNMDEINKVNKVNTYNELLAMFVELVCQPKWVLLLCEILKNQSIQYVRENKMSMKTLLYVYNFLSTYRTTFHLSETFLKELRELFTLQTYQLNPSVADLLHNNLYKLYVQDKLYLVPLWHHKSYFSDTLMVICEPEFSEEEKQQNVFIDEDNNLYLDMHLDCSNLLRIFLDSVNSADNPSVSFRLGNKTFDIPLAALCWTREPQIYRCVGQGISIEMDIEHIQQNIQQKADIVVQVFLH